MDINKIIDMSKGMMLDHGHHYPTVYVEFKDDPTWQLCVLADFMTIRTTSEKEKALFASGAGMGRAKPDKEIAAISFVNEAWTSRYASEKQMRNAPPPSEDPNRGEALIVIMLDLTTKPSKQTGQAIEIIRAGGGGIDLLPQAKPDEVRTNFLVSFSAGFKSVKLSEKDLYHFVASVTPGASRQVRRAMLRDLQKLHGKAQLMDLDEFKSYQGSR